MPNFSLIFQFAQKCLNFSDVQLLFYPIFLFFACGFNLIKEHYFVFLPPKHLFFHFFLCFFWMTWYFDLFSGKLSRNQGKATQSNDCSLTKLKVTCKKSVTFEQKEKSTKYYVTLSSLHLFKGLLGPSLLEWILRFKLWQI